MPNNKNLIHLSTHHKSYRLQRTKIQNGSDFDFTVALHYFLKFDVIAVVRKSKIDLENIINYSKQVFSTWSLLYPGAIWRFRSALKLHETWWCFSCSVLQFSKYTSPSLQRYRLKRFCIPQLPLETFKSQRAVKSGSFPYSNILCIEHKRFNPPFSNKQTQSFHSFAITT